MGHGIARQVRDKYPKVYEEYKRYCDAHADNRLKMLGDALIVDAYSGEAVHDYLIDSEDSKFIANIFGQLTYGPGLRTNYKAFITGLESVASFANEHNLSVAIPYKIGCGLGGGDWAKMYIFIEGIFGGSNIDVEICRFERFETYEIY